MGFDVIKSKKRYFYIRLYGFVSENWHDITSPNERVGWLQNVVNSRHDGQVPVEVK